MNPELKIDQIEAIAEAGDGLAELLSRVVENGASIGFLPPLGHEEASAYWSGLLQTDVRLFVARLGDRIAGTVQVHLCMKQNGSHRAEICKLMTHPEYRRKGIARALMQRAEECAMQEGRQLLVLDTREGDPSNELYASLGYIRAGRIPYYARSAGGQLDATILYYKLLLTETG